MTRPKTGAGQTKARRLSKDYARERVKEKPALSGVKGAGYNIFQKSLAKFGALTIIKNMKPIESNLLNNPKSMARVSLSVRTTALLWGVINPGYFLKGALLWLKKK